MKKVITFVVLFILVLAMLVPIVVLAADEALPAGVDFWEYIKPEAYSLIPALFLIGVFIKKIPKIPDWIIPFVLMMFGVIGAVLIIGFTIYGIVQGVLVAGAAVYINQLGKQLLKGRDEMNGTDAKDV